jgi:hypothetical protein
MQLRIVSFALLALVAASPTTVAAKQTISFSSSQFIPNGADCNWNTVPDRDETVHANRDDDGDGVCNAIDYCPLEGGSCPMQAITVPAWAEDPVAPHVTYSGATTTLKGIARYGGNQYMWDFGDGTPATAWSAIANPYNLGMNHVYTGAVGQEFTATLSVRNSASPGVVTSATYPIAIKDGGSVSSLTREQTDVRAQMALDQALWYLHTNISRGTYGAAAPGYSQQYGTVAGGLADTCAVAAAFASHGHVASRPWQVQVDEFDNGANLVPYRFDPYVENSRRLINYMLANSVVQAIAVQPAGNPDWNGNGNGVSIGPNEFRQNGLCAMAFAESAGTDWFAQTGPVNVYGRTHPAVSQDLVDWLAFGQADGVGGNRGGWTYQANAGATNDVLRWVVLALGSQERKMGARVPAFVRSEVPVWLGFSRYSALDPRHGSSGYAAPNDFNTVAWTASAMLGRLFAFNLPNPVEMKSAVGFIARSWTENDNGWHTNLGDSHAMSAVAQAFRAAQPPIAVISDYNYVLGQPDLSTAFHWYYGPANARQTGYAGNLIARQNANGSFSDAIGAATDGNGFSPNGRTALAVMVLRLTGASSAAAASAPCLNFGAVDVGTVSSAQVVTLTNDGDYSFAFDSITATGRFAVTSSCGSLLPPAGEGAPHHCTVSVTFRPTAEEVVSGTLTVASAGLPATTIALSGVGTAPKLTPAISWPSSAITYGTALGSTELNATTDVPGTFDYSPAAGTTLDTGTGQLLSVTFTPADGAHYVSVTTTTFVDVAPASPTVAVTAATVEYDGQPHAATATATGVSGEALGPITITYNGQSEAPVSAGTYAVVAGVGASGNYTAASATASLVITKATPTVTWPTPPSITYGAALDSVSLNASASVPGTFTYMPAPGAVLGGGAGQALTVTFTPDDSVNHAVATAATVIDVLRATPNVSVTGGTFTYDGQAHAATASTVGVNAEVLSPPSVTYNGQPGVPTAAGVYSVLATTAANANYESASSTAVITIDRAAATVTAGSGSKMYGTADPVMTPTATGFLPADNIVVTQAGRDAGTEVGSYATYATATGAAITNYSVTMVPGVLSVIEPPPAVNSAPVCSTVSATPTVIWPANGQWINVNLSGATDADGGPLQLRIASIFQDESTDSTEDGRGVGTSTASVRAERLGNGNGRAYRIAFVVTDQGGLSCTGSVIVGVPHNQKAPVVDDGPRFDSTLATGGRGR